MSEHKELFEKIKNQETWQEFKESKLLDGLSENSRERAITSQLLENTRSNILGKLKESGDTTQTGDFARYDMMFMPLVRRVTPSLISMNLVGNQPLPGPTGMIRTVRFRYGRDVDSSDESPSNQVVESGDEASGMNVYDKYSFIASDGVYDDFDYTIDNDLNADQTVALEGDGGNPMYMDVTRKTVTATTRKLRAQWSREAEDDSAALDGLNIESEMMSVLADQITRDLDRELLIRLQDLAGITDSFDYSNADGRYAGEKFTALTIAFSELSNRIAFRTYRGGATWMVVTPQILTVLRNAANGSFTPATANHAISPQDSLFAGVFNGNINVYVDVHNNSSDPYVLLGYKGNNELDTGMVYCPYIPMEASGVVYSPENFDPRMNLRTRYAIASFEDEDTDLGNSPDFYAKASITNLSLGFT